MCISVVEPATPTITSFTRSSSNPTTSLELVWAGNSNNVASVEYFVRLGAANRDNNKPQVRATTGTHTFTGLVPGESYTAVLVAVTGTGSIPSDSASSQTVYTSKS